MCVMPALLIKFNKTQADINAKSENQMGTFYSKISHLFYTVWTTVASNLPVNTA